MKFYIDFEATQFCERIISIGCVSETGYRFESLVKPLNKYKITPFITNLTGITKEEIILSPTANEVFHSFYFWITSNTPVDDKPEFICYGNCDQRYVTNTLKDVTDWYATLVLSLIKANLKDISIEIAKQFSRTSINLKAAYNILTQEQGKQSHNALEDAEILKYVAENLPSEPISAECTTTAKKVKLEKAPEIYSNWSSSGKNKFIVNTLGTPENYKVKCVCSMGNYEKYFDCMTTAVLWAIKYLHPTVEKNKKAHPCKVQDIEYITKTILKGIKKGKQSYGFSWEVKEC